MEAFSSQGDGTLTVIKEDSPTSFSVEQTVPTPARADDSRFVPDRRDWEIVSLRNPIVLKTHGHRGVNPLFR
jgi:hypothetical protein